MKKQTLIILSVTLSLFVIGHSCKKEPVELATINTTSVSEILGNSASCGGEIIGNGGGEITESGICWTTGGDPTISNSKLIDGAVSGTFTCIMNELEPFTQYFVRAYAINEAGTAYGNTMTFSTKNVPWVTTSEVAEITKYTAKCGGNAQVYEQTNIISRGVCWSTSTNPTIDDNKTGDGDGTGDFTSEITGLSGGTTYYVRAYATDMYGTGYGESISFTTIEEGAIVPVTDIDGNTYEAITIGNQIWMGENLKTKTLNTGESLSEDNSNNYNPEDASYLYYEDNENNIDEYGLLYSFESVETGNLCPDGWRVPTSTDLNTLVSYIETNYDNTGYANSLKSTSGWADDATGDNFFGFTAKPSGYYLSNYPNNDGFLEQGTKFGMFSNTTYYDAEENLTYAYSLFLSYNNDDIRGLNVGEAAAVRVGSNDYYLGVAYSVRCIKE